MDNVLNLGAGVQSTTVLRMSLRGELDPIDHVIFADTGWEPSAVYEHLAVLESEMSEAGVAFHRVSCGRNIKEDALEATVRGLKTEGQRFASLPLITRAPDNSLGMIRRQCTREYKIDPINRKLRALMGIGRKTKTNNQPSVIKWFGISLDEIQRTRTSGEWWAVNYYPLVINQMTRRDCLEWLVNNGYERPHRSACIGCPYHNNKEWRRMKIESPEEFNEACDFDDAIRHRGGMRGQLFIHWKGIPLRDVDLRTLEDHGQGNLFSDECAGVCGV